MHKDAMARPLRIGLQIDLIDSGYARVLAAGISSLCREKGASFVIFSGQSKSTPDGRLCQNAEIFRHINQRNIDAVIIASGTQSSYISYDQYLEYIHALSPLPIVSLSMELPGITSILIENADGFLSMLRHLRDKHACKRFAVISGPADNSEVIIRMEAYHAFLSESGFPEENGLVLSGNFTDRSGYLAMKKLCDEATSLPDTIVAMNDMMAIGAIRFCEEKGIAVPGDVIVTGFDNITRSRFLLPSLTTVSQNMRMQSRIAAEYALSLAMGLDVPPVTRIPTKLLCRKSCGCVGRDERQIESIDEYGQQVLDLDDYDFCSGYERFRLEDEFLQLRQYLGRLHETPSIADLMLALRSDLEYFRMRSCAICVYCEKITDVSGWEFNFPDRAELVLAYDESSQSGNSSKKGRVFFNPREDMIPPGVFTDRPRALVVTALSHREAQLGYIVYEPGDIDIAIYETLCVQLSRGISSALVFTEKLALERKLSNALRRLEDTNSKLSEMSRTDELTGLLNRRGFLSLGQQAINLSLGMNKTGLVIFSDLDGLKTINDTWGHDSGDRALRAMADVLRKTFRSADVISRIAGDEFAIVTVDASPGFLDVLNERIDDLLRAWNESSGEPFELSVSLGAAEFAEDSSDLVELLSLADTLLYDAKRQKKIGNKTLTGNS